MKYTLLFLIFGLTYLLSYTAYSDVSKMNGRVCYGGSLEKGPPRKDKDNKLGIQIDNGKIVPVFYSPKIIVENLDVLKPHIAHLMWEGKPMQDWKKPITLKFKYTKGNDMMVVFFRPGRWRVEPARNGKCEIP